MVYLSSTKQKSKLKKLTIKQKKEKHKLTKTYLNKQKTKEENKKLKEWKLAVKERDNYTCQICHKKLSGANCQAHHIFPSGIKELKTDIDNGICLCYQHHKVGIYSPHMNAIWFTNWFIDNKEKQYKLLMEKQITARLIK